MPVRHGMRASARTDRAGRTDHPPPVCLAHRPVDQAGSKEAVRRNLPRSDHPELPGVLDLSPCGEVWSVPLTPTPAESSRRNVSRSLAVVQHRTWVKQMVIVVLEDPDDPTLYGLVSTKLPDNLLAILVAHGVQPR